jgi:uracil-DNA glycosylase
VRLFDYLHPDWKSALHDKEDLIDSIDLIIQKSPITPAYDFVFRALTRSIDSTCVVIFGQDPYPTQGHAHGLAFSVDAKVDPLPASLRNIYKELESDLGVKRQSGDLSDWFDQGVMLINRILTTELGTSLSHAKLGWQEVTDSVAKTLGERDVVAVLWGQSALELKQYFADDCVISSAHPSPLSAYRGFFESRPFSKMNLKLRNKGFAEINW